MIREDLARKVLTVGAQYKNHRGGIGGVIAVYARYFRPFNYIATFRPYRQKIWYIPYFAWAYLRFVGTLLMNRKVEIVHLHGSADGSFVRKYVLFLTAKKGFGRKVVYHVHAGRFIRFYHNNHPLLKRCIRQVVEGSDVVLCLSQEWHRQFTAAFPAARVQVLGNVVEPFAGPEKNYANRVNQPLNVLFLGLIGDNKGIFDTLNMLAEHRTELTGKLKLTIGGNGDIDRLKRVIQQHGLESLVTFAGWVTGDAKQQLLQEADVYLLPSYSEGLPVSILEAMSARLAILSTPVGGIPELVQDGVNGYLAQPGDTKTVYRQLTTLINNPELVRSMGEQSIRLVNAFEPAQVFDRLGQVYASLLPAPEPATIPSSQLA